jgi:FtsP/CotA-like multicopper oxidase with cupredoxin domain
MPGRHHRLWRITTATLLVWVASILLGAGTTPDLLPPDPPGEVHSHNGLLEVELRAEAGKVHLGDLNLAADTYNGIYAGPILHVRPGDLLRVRLVNRLTEPTNLHFHGIQTSPMGNSDNVHISVPGGASFTYEVRIPPTQPPGLYWYHSHVHGLSEQQVMGGLSGALLVEDGAASNVTQLLFVLKDMIFEDNTDIAEIDDELHGIVQSINGQIDSVRTMRPHETQLWRFSNQSADRAFHIALQGHQFRIVALDGEATITEQTTDVLDIMPSARVDVLVDGGEPGNYALLSKGVMTGTGAERQPDRVLGRLLVAGDPAQPPASRAPAPAPPNLQSARITARRTVVFTQTNTLKEAEQKFFINGRLFDAERVDFRIPLGSVEEWSVRNESDDLHVFHIHQLGFQVMEINGSAVPFNGRVDTIRVPERGEVKLRMAFTDKLILGRFMFHCHVLKHEDRGMMGQLEVYDPRPPSLPERFRQWYFHAWWWLHGVAWALCTSRFA